MEKLTERQSQILDFIRDHEDIDIKKSKELHKSDCPWIALMDSKNKVKFEEKLMAFEKGYDRCGHCFNIKDRES